MPTGVMRRRILTYVIPLKHILSPLCPTAERRRILTCVRGNEEDTYRCHSTETNSQKSWPYYTYHILSLSLKGHEEEDTYIFHSTETNSLTNSSDCPCVLTKPYP
jgi:hypothetical protein